MALGGVEIYEQSLLLSSFLIFKSLLKYFSQKRLMLVYEKNSGWKVGPVSEGENIVTLTPDMVTEIFFFHNVKACLLSTFPN